MDGNGWKIERVCANPLALSRILLRRVDAVVGGDKGMVGIDSAVAIERIATGVAKI